MARKSTNPKANKTARRDWPLIGETVLKMTGAMLITALLYVALYTVLYISRLTEKLPHEVIHLYIPFFMSGIAGWWSYSRLPIRSKGDARFLIVLFWVLLTFFLCIRTESVADNFLTTTRHQADLSKVDSRPLVDRIHIQSLNIDTARRGQKIDVRTIGKRHSTDIEFAIYYVFPITDTQNAYYGIRYSQQHPYSFTPDRKLDRWFNEFLEMSERRIQHVCWEDVKCVNRLKPSRRLTAYRAAIQEMTTGTRPASETMVYEGVDIDKTATWGRDICIILLILTSGAVFIFLCLLGKHTSRKTLTENAREAHQDRLQMQNLLFAPRMLHISLPPIIMTLYFIIMALSGVSIAGDNTENMIQWGAGSYDLIVIQGQWWRLLTNIFIHNGIMHLLENIISYGLVAYLLNCFISSKQFTLLFFGSALAAALCCTYLASYTFVGASGGVMGLVGAIGVFAFAPPKQHKSQKTFIVFFAFFVGINLLMSLQNSISMTAHVSGLIAGGIIALGIFLFAHRQELFNN